MTQDENKFWTRLKGPRYWSRANTGSGYTFVRRGRITKEFVDAINKGPITRNEFLIKLGRNPRPGLLASFFAAMRQSGIAKLDTKTWTYTPGPNMDHFEAGMLWKTN